MFQIEETVNMSLDQSLKFTEQEDCSPTHNICWNECITLRYMCVYLCRHEVAEAENTNWTGLQSITAHTHGPQTGHFHTSGQFIVFNLDIQFF